MSIPAQSARLPRSKREPKGKRKLRKLKTYGSFYKDQTKGSSVETLDLFHLEKNRNPILKGSQSLREMRVYQYNPWQDVQLPTRRVLSLRELPQDDDITKVPITPRDRNITRFKSKKKRKSSKRRRRQKKKRSPRKVIKEVISSPRLFKRNSVPDTNDPKIKPTFDFNKPDPPSGDEGSTFDQIEENRTESEIYCELNISDLNPETSCEEPVRELLEPPESPALKDNGNRPHLFQPRSWTEEKSDCYEKVNLWMVLETEINGNDITRIILDSHSVMIYRPVEGSRMYIIQTTQRVNKRWSTTVGLNSGEVPSLYRLSGAFSS